MKLVLSILITFFLFYMLINISFAVPAEPSTKELTQPDGEKFNARIIGDEHHYIMETEDEYTIVKDSEGWWRLADLDNNGKFIASGHRVSKDGQYTSQKHLREVQVNLDDIIKKSFSPSAGKFFAKGSSSSSPAYAPVTGTQKTLVILINFTDTSQSSSNTPSYYENLIFNSGNGANSMANYFEEVSYNKINITGSVAGSKWYSVSNNLTWYGSDVTDIDEDITQANRNNRYIFKLAKEAIQLADNDVDYTQYDGDNDGVIDHIIIVHAGNGQESLGVSTDIWSHRWIIQVWDGSQWNEGYTTNDGVRAVGYTMVAENSPLGTFVHEFAHDLGLPDLYNTTGGNSIVGTWDLMDYGSWAGTPSGSNPSHLSAWSKIKLGWLDVTNVTSGTSKNTTLAPLSSSNNSAIRVPISSTEYFLVENRQTTAAVYDAALPESGILIWHVDESRTNNNGAVKMIIPEDQNPSTSTLNDTAFTSGQSFTPSTNPNSTRNNGSATNIFIDKLQQVGTNYSVRFNNSDSTPPIVTIISPTNSTYTTSPVSLSIILNEDANWCGRSLDDTTNTTLTNISGSWNEQVSISDGSHFIKFYCNDTVGYTNFTSVYFSVDAIPPNVSFVPPSDADNSFVNRNYTAINVTVTDSNNIDACILEWNGTNSSMAKTGSGNSVTCFINKTDTDGSFTYKIYANNSFNNFGTSSRAITFDTQTSYIINITYSGGYGNIFSPNSDGVFDDMTFVSYANEIVNWSTIRIYNSSGQQVKTFYAVDNSLSITKTWNGSCTPSYCNGIVPDGNYTANTTITDRAGNSNTTTVATFIVDVTPPTYATSAPVTPPSYDPNLLVNFTISWSDREISTRLIEENFTGSHRNSTMNSTYSIVLPAGRFQYRYLANDTAGNWNATNVSYITVSAQEITINLTINGNENNRTLEYSETVNATGQKNVNEGNLTLYRNGTIISVTQGGTFITNISTLGTGVYNYTITLNSSNYTANPVTRFVTVQDMTPPSASSSIMSPIKVRRNSNVTFISKIIDFSGVNHAYLTGYNSSWNEIYAPQNLSNTSDSWYLIFNASSVSNGLYYFNLTVVDILKNNKTIWASNLTVNETSGANKIIINNSLSIPNNQTIINASETANATIEFKTNRSISNTIAAISSYTQNPGTPNTEIPSLNKYLEITTDSQLNDSLSWAVITIYYNDSDIPSGYNENNLRIYYNAPNGSWTPYVSPNGDVNTSANYVWANTTHFSLFGIYILPTCSDGLQNQGEAGADCGGPCNACSSGSGESSSGGGGGGGGALTITPKPTTKPNETKEESPISAPSSYSVESNKTIGKNETSQQPKPLPTTGFVIFSRPEVYPILLIVIIIPIAAIFYYFKKLKKVKSKTKRSR